MGSNTNDLEVTKSVAYLITESVVSVRMLFDKGFAPFSEQLDEVEIKYVTVGKTTHQRHSVWQLLGEAFTACAASGCIKGRSSAVSADQGGSKTLTRRTLPSIRIPTRHRHEDAPLVSCLGSRHEEGVKPWRHYP